MKYCGIREVASIDQLINLYIDISSQIDAIMQDPQQESPQDPPVEEDSNDNETPLEKQEDKDEN
jgi:hypothetical protein